MIKKQLIKKYAFNILVILVGTFLMGVSFSVFLSPNKISPTGFSGIASLISNLLAQHAGFNLSPSIIYLVMNAILFAIAFKTMGLEFIILSATGVGGFSLSMQLCTYIKLSVGGDLLLCALYGGLLMGFGAGLVLRVGGSTGGGDTIACMLKHSHVKITIGQIVMIIDAVLIVASCIAYGINYGMYAIIACILMGYVCDIVINGVKGTRAYYIVTSKPDEVYQEIEKHVHRGMTQINATGMYTHTNKSILMCLLSRAEIAGLKRAVKNADKDAFMYSVDVKEAIGVGFEPMQKNNEKQTAQPVEQNQVESSKNEDNNQIIVEENNIVNKPKATKKTTSQNKAAFIKTQPKTTKKVAKK